MSRQPGSKENKDFLSFSDMAAPIVSGDSEGVYTELTSQDNHEYYTLSRTSHDSPGPQHTDKTAQSLHPYKRTAVCLGLLCALLLIATLALLVLYTSLSQKYSALDASLKSGTGDEHKDEQLRHCTWLKELLQKKHENQRAPQLIIVVPQIVWEENAHRDELPRPIRLKLDKTKKAAENGKVCTRLSPVTDS
ncbi:hypothetical protein AGOR_G00001810 [Albula goreensis]|uniref:Uncharacterized protein n=1 Tax=Albula goreensis TaxID=1534307 RepID=A0A8T3E452_9TELE|nr:hypothetical protein AGOR_G00001810 [Albula goreensis]